MPMDTNLFHKPRPGVGGVYSPVPVQSTHDPCMWPRKRKTHLPVRQSLPEHFPVESAIQLLLPYQPLIQSIRTEVGLPESHWQEIYRPVVHHYAELCQRLPASEAHHHADTGGLLRHGLETLSEALKLRRRQLLPPGAPAEEIARQQDLWTYAVATSALLHDVGKPINDLVVTFVLSANGKQQRWQPLTTPLPAGAHYRFRFDPQRQYRRHALIPPLLAHRLIPPAGLDWLASEPRVFDAWLATISGDDTSDPLATIAHEADGLSAARDLTGGARTRSPAARAKPLSDRLLTGLRFMVKESLITLNRPGASGFVSDGSLWLVSKRVLDELREHLTKEGQTGIPARNDRLMDELQQWQVIRPNHDKAVWHCQVRIGDWSQALTCLRMDADKIWPDPKGVPMVDDCTVTPADKATEAPLDKATTNAETSVVQAPMTANDLDSSESCTTTAQASSSDAYDGLPLPFEFPSAVEKQPAIECTTSASTALTTKSQSATDDDNDIGRRFVDWLAQNIRDKRVEINTPRARLHVLHEGLAIITPGTFRDFSPERWEHAQKRFQKLKIHKKTANDTNVWTCQVAKDRKHSIIRVMLIPDAETVFGTRLPNINPVLKLIR